MAPLVLQKSWAYEGVSSYNNTYLSVLHRGYQECNMPNFQYAKSRSDF